MNNRKSKKGLHISTYIIIYKLILGLLELLLGLGIILFQKNVLQIYESFKTQEFLEDPHDLLVKLAENVVPFVLEHRGYIVLILILLGVVKIIGAIGLLYRQHWGLDILVVLTFLLLPFQSYSLLTNPSLYKVIYFTINALIALYLVEFKPKSYFVSLKTRIKSYK